MTMLPAISILQPYAWLIIRPDLTDPQARAEALAAGQIKDIENRGWATKFRGRILIHAGKKYGRREHEEYAVDMLDDFGIDLPPFEQMQLGGIVGSATITDCVQEHPSRWKILGSWGFVLKDQRVRPFVPYRGQLSIFRVPSDVIEATA